MINECKAATRQRSQEAEIVLLYSSRGEDRGDEEGGAAGDSSQRDVGQK